MLAPSSPVHAAFGVGLWPGLTALARDALPGIEVGTKGWCLRSNQGMPAHPITNLLNLTHVTFTRGAEPLQPGQSAPSDPMRAVPTEQLALDLPMPDERPPVEIDAHPDVEKEPPPEAPRRKPAAPRPAVTAAPPASVPPAAPRQASRYGPILLAWLKRYRDYPRAARLRRQEGEVLLRLTVDRTGRLLGTEIERPSGVDVLDQAALDTARRAAPMPPVPANEPGERLILLVPILFALAKG